MGAGRSGAGEPGSACAAASPGRDGRSSNAEPGFGAAALTNARVELARLRACSEPDGRGRALLAHAMESLSLSARAHGRLLRVARTIADLEGSPSVRASHVAEAIQHRCLDRPVEVVGTG
jgi:magnesium chelatase family protein